MTGVTFTVFQAIHTRSALVQVGTTLKVSAKEQNKDFASAELCKAMFDIYVGYTSLRFF